MAAWHWVVGQRRCVGHSTDPVRYWCGGQPSTRRAGAGVATCHCCMYHQHVAWMFPVEGPVAPELEACVLSDSAPSGTAYVPSLQVLLAAWNSKRGW